MSIQNSKQSVPGDTHDYEAFIEVLKWRDIELSHAEAVYPYESLWLMEFTRRFGSVASQAGDLHYGRPGAQSDLRAKLIELSALSLAWLDDLRRNPREDQNLEEETEAGKE